MKSEKYEDSMEEDRDNTLTTKWKKILWNKQCKKDKIKKGYSKEDLWSIDWWFVRTIPNMLEDLADTTIGYPDTRFSSLEEWQEELRNMAKLFRESDEELSSEKNEYWEEYSDCGWDWIDEEGNRKSFLETKANVSYTMEFRGSKELEEKYSKREKELEKYREKCLDEAFEKFRKNFYSLWW